jgi:hypothetical protein
LHRLKMDLQGGEQEHYVHNKPCDNDARLEDGITPPRRWEACMERLPHHENCEPSAGVNSPKRTSVPLPRETDNSRS